MFQVLGVMEITLYSLLFYKIVGSEGFIQSKSNYCCRFAARNITCCLLVMLQHNNAASAILFAYLFGG